SSNLGLDEYKQPGDQPWVINSLSPWAQRAIDHINDKWNKIDVKQLNNELKHLRVEFANSPDILAEIESISQRIINPQGSGNSHTNTYRKKTSCFYGEKDKGPLIVIIERIDFTTTNLNPVTVGKMLCSNPKYRDIKIVNINGKGIKSVGIQVGTKEQANELIRNSDFDPKILMFIYRPEWCPSWALSQVEIYIPQCNKCLHFGHTQKSCRGKSICANCGGNHEEADKCKYETKCLYCKQRHTAKDRLCPEYMRQQKIREIMTLHNISLFEADKATQNK
ncbi:hypothetical protein HHI36_012975, partial [Cryptolaemus montrouzieri]